MRAQRTAVLRLPARDAGGAGVTRAICMDGVGNQTSKLHILRAMQWQASVGPPDRTTALPEGDRRSMHSPQRAPSAHPVASAAAAADAAAACPEPAAALASACAEQLRIARVRTLGLFDDLPANALLGPRLPVVNPPLWELGHLGWFQERWLLRARPAAAAAA